MEIASIPWDESAATGRAQTVATENQFYNWHADREVAARRARPSVLSGVRHQKAEYRSQATVSS
jgi:hypothetical protein